MPKLTDWNPSSHSWFLGIGIDAYKNFDPLSNAVKGVQEIQKVLLKDYDLDSDCIKTLYNKEATKENIVDTLDELGDKIKPGDKLLIYYSGHGHLNNAMGLGYWIPIDAKRGKASSYLPNSTIRDYVKGIKAKHILLISDSCFSGSLFMQGAFRMSRAVKELDNLNSRWAICSGRHDEEVYDGAPGENSPFTQSFIDFLKGNDKECVNVGRVADHVIEQTAANYEQLPDGRPMFGVGHRGGQYIFWKNNVLSPTSGEGKTKKANYPNETISTLSELPKSPSRIVRVGAIALGIITTLLSVVFLMPKEDVIESPNDLSSVTNDYEKKELFSSDAATKKASPSTTSKKKNIAPVTLISSLDDATIELFESGEYKGRVLKLHGDQEMSNLSNVSVEDLKFEDVISSVRLTIPVGYEFVMYEKRRFRGESLKISGTGKTQFYPNIGKLQDKVSSFKLIKVE